ncbi:hypothetical protein ACIKTA_08450 [Hansschlegelia beijingensis]
MKVIAMHLVQLFLPLFDNHGRTFPHALFAEVREELVARFGGVTAFTQAPADGVWKDGDDVPTRDRIVIFEVMCDRLERDWWADYRRLLAERFRQEELVVRTWQVDAL